MKILKNYWEVWPKKKKWEYNANVHLLSATTVQGGVLLLENLLSFLLVQHLVFWESIFLPLPRFQSHSPDFPVWRISSYPDWPILLDTVMYPSLGIWHRQVLFLGVQMGPGERLFFCKILNSKGQIGLTFLGPSLLPEGWNQYRIFLPRDKKRGRKRK